MPATGWLPNPDPFPSAPPDRWPDAPPPGAPPPAGPSRARAVVGVLAVLAVLAAAVAGAIVIGDDGDDEVSAPSTTEPLVEPSEPLLPPGSTTPEEAPTVEEVLDDLIAFVEQERGRPFRSRPLVEVVPDDQFEADLQEQLDGDRPEIEADETLYRALGIIDPDAVLFDVFQDLLDASALGFYDSETEELLVRGAAATPFVRQVIVHELTHALDDQYFELDRPDLEDAPDDVDLAFTALVEGSARVVETRYTESLTPDEQVEALDEALQFGLDPSLLSLPLGLIAVVQVPYVFGEPFVQGLVDDGGPGAVDAAYGEPPATTEQVIDPARYADGQPGVEVTPPPADGEVVDEGTLGAAGLAAVLDEVGAITGSVDEAVDGWGGDAFVAWRDADDRSCIRMRVAGDTAADEAELQSAFEDWAGRGDDTIVSTVPADGRSLVEVTSCR